MKSIFEYSDYRTFLADYYAEKRAKNSSFSYRFMAQRVGFKSAGHFTKIIQGKANISVALALRFAEFYKFNKKQTDYFQTLVLFNQAKNHEDKRRYFEKIISYKTSAIVTINAEQDEFYSKWYYAIVREILAYLPVNDNFAELAQHVIPPISEAEAIKAIEVLERLGFIAKKESGYYQQTNSLLMSNQEAGTFFIDNYIMNSLDLAREAIHVFPKNERKLSSTALTVSKDTFSKIVEELREFRKHILTVAQQDKNPDRSYLLNVQIFPVSKDKR